MNRSPPWLLIGRDSVEPWNHVRPEKSGLDGVWPYRYAIAKVHGESRWRERVEARIGVET
jgi:hypothetical protein